MTAAFDRLDDLCDPLDVFFWEGEKKREGS